MQNPLSVAKQYKYADAVGITVLQIVMPHTVASSSSYEALL